MILQAVQIKQKIEEVLDTIASAAIRSGRDPRKVKLIVVTKAQPIEVLQAVFEAGWQRVGENYPEETRDKIATMGSIANSIEWHMIGHLQSRKSIIIVQNFHYLHSLDSLHLAQRLNRQLEEAQKKLPVLLEMNVGGEESKSGWQAWDEERWIELVDKISQVNALHYLDIRGLMTMPPYDPNPEKTRPYFSRLMRLSDFLQSHVPGLTLEEMSMGTSGDYEVAVEEGATFVRVGQAIVGARNYLT